MGPYKDTDRSDCKQGNYKTHWSISLSLYFHGKLCQKASRTVCTSMGKLPLYAMMRRGIHSECGCWAQSDMCAQSCRTGRVNVNQLQPQDINLALLRRTEEPTPPPIHAYTHTQPPSLPHPHRTQSYPPSPPLRFPLKCCPVHVSVSAETHSCIQPNGDSSTQQPPCAA